MPQPRKGKTPKLLHPPVVVIDDDRFKHAVTDPIFRRVPRKEKKVDIDKRFQSMFHDKSFKLKYSIDKRGRPVDLTTNEDLRQYYNLVEDEEEQGASKRLEDDEPTQKVDGNMESDSDVGSDEEIEGNVRENDIGTPDKTAKLSKTLKKKLHDNTLDFARGDGVLAEDSSDDSDSTEDELGDADETIHAWGELDRDSERTEEPTSRLALCNMDWDRLKAVDLMVLFHSFLPPGGVINSIKIYTSEYGKERLADEDKHGPLELRNTESDMDEESDSENVGLLKRTQQEDEEGNQYHMEKLRKYQLNRLKYFYGVLELDSIATAEKVYNECDGMEYESSATRLDLRYIPEEMVFEDEPTDSCDSLPLPEKYRPRFFTTTALQQAKVILTWDETDPLRRELTQKVHNPKEKVDDEDLRAYLASSDSDDDVEKEIGSDAANTMDKYRALLDSIEKKGKKDKDVEMEITWGVGLKEKTESLVKKRLEEEAATKLTPWEEILEKKKEKRKMKKTQKKEEYKNDPEFDEDANSDQMFSDDDVDVDMNDPFFKEEIESNEILKKGKGKATKNQKSKAAKEDASAGDKNAELELLLMDETDNKQHFNFKKIVEADTQSKSKKKKKGRRGKKDGKSDAAVVSDTFQMDVEDDRFNALFSSHLYNVDPSDPNFKKTKGMEAIMTEKQKRRSAQVENGATATEEGTQPKIRKNELAYLIKSVKRNTETLKRKDGKRK